MTIAEYPAYKSYKDTGIEWARFAPVDWKIKPISAVAKIVSVTGSPELQLLSVYLDRGVIRFSDVEEKRTNATSSDLSKYQIVEPGHLVLNNQQAWRGSVGVSMHRGIVSPAYIVLKLSEDFERNFANYYFRTTTTVSHYRVSSKGVGTIQRNLYWQALKGCPVVIPPLPEQCAISQFLDEKCAGIDEAVRVKEQQIDLLRERRQILIQEAVTRGLNPDAPMKDSGVDWIGQIPAHWVVGPGRICIYENEEKNMRLKEKQVLSLSYGRVIVKTEDKLTGLVPESFETYQIVRPGDIIVRGTDLQNDVTSLRTGLAKDRGIITSAYINLRPKANT